MSFCHDEWVVAFYTAQANIVSELGFLICLIVVLYDYNEKKT